MANIGCAFQLKGDGFHLWIVISGENSEGKVVAVNLTDAKNYPGSTCHLKSGEHPFISKPSVAQYKKARIWPSAIIDQQITAGTFIKHADASTELLGKIIQGALSSDDIPPKILAYIKPL